MKGVETGLVGNRKRWERPSPAHHHQISATMTVRLCILRVCCTKPKSRCENRQENKMVEMVTVHVASGASPLDLGNHGRTINLNACLSLSLELDLFAASLSLGISCLPDAKTKTQQSGQATRQCNLQLNLPRLMSMAK